MINHLLYTLVFVTGLNFCSFAGTDLLSEKPSSRLVSGKVIDKISGEELAGVEIRIEGQAIYTDLNGNFTASLSASKAEAIVKFISYAETRVTLDAFSFSSVIVALESH